jgi:hypothetical protein
MKNAGFWNVTPYVSGKNRHFRGTYDLRHQAVRMQLTRNNVSSNCLDSSSSERDSVAS